MAEETEELSELRESAENARQEERWEDLAGILISLTGATEKPEEQIQALVEAGEISAEKLEDVPKARELLAIALELAEDLEDLTLLARVHERLVIDGEEPLASLDALEAVYAELSDWAKLYDTFSRRLEQTTESDEKVERLRQMGMVQEEALQDDHEATTCYERLLVLAPGDSDALGRLEALYQKAERWDDLVDCYRGQLETAEDPLSVLHKMGGIERAHLDADVALSTYETILERSPHDAPALEAVAQLHRSAERWESLCKILMLTADTTEEESIRLAKYCEAAQLAVEKCENVELASKGYQSALRVNKAHMPAIDGLLGILMETEQYPLAAQVYELKSHAQQTDEDKIATLLKMAELQRDHIADESAALRIYESILEIDRNQCDALHNMVSHHIRHAEWVQAMPLLEALIDGLTDAHDAELAASTYRMMGRCAKELLDHEKALLAYTAAHERIALDATDLMNLADLRFVSEKYQEAQDLYETLLKDDEAGLNQDQMRHLKMNLSQCALKTGQTEAALDYVSDVEQSAVQSVQDLERMIAVLTENGDFEQVITYRTKLLAEREEPLARYQQQLAIGDIYADHLDDRESAISAYRKALDIGNYSRAPMLRLIQFYMEKEEYTPALDYLSRLTDLEDDVKRKSKWCMSIAAIYRDGLGEPHAAVTHFERALDYDPTGLESFQAIDEILNRASDWTALEEAYLRMLKRVKDMDPSPKNRNLLFMLFRNLGEIYRTRLQDPEKAITSLESALRYNAGDTAIREVVARLCVSTPEHLENAQTHYRFLIADQPDRFAYYHSLSALYASSGNVDGAWRVAGLLALHGEALDAEFRLYKKHLGANYIDPPKTLSDEIWQTRVLSPGENPILGQIFAWAYAATEQTLEKKTAKDLGLSKKDRVTSAAHPQFMTALQTVCRVFEVEVPELYLSEKQEEPLSVLKIAKPALMVSDVFLEEADPKRAAFELSRQLVYLHPWHIIASHFDVAQLEAIFMACGRVVGAAPIDWGHEQLPDEEQAALNELAARMTPFMEKGLGDKDKQQLRVAVDEVAKLLQPGSIAAWLGEIERTGIRAGVLMANDPMLVGQTVLYEPSDFSDLTGEQKVATVVRYALSDAYQSLRKDLDLALALGWDD